jgi:DNA-binding transcriptional MerR regulator
MLRARANGLLPRPYVAKLLGVSEFTVRSLEKRGWLKPEKKEAGVWYYTPASVTDVAHKMLGNAEGDLAAEIFRRFAAKQTLRQIVTELRVTPAKVRALYRDFVTTLDAGDRAARKREARERARAELAETTEHYDRLARELEAKLGSRTS